VRIAFFALLLVNLMYFAWARWIDVTRPPALNDGIAQLPQLKLAHELPPSQRPKADTAADEKNRTQ